MFFFYFSSGINIIYLYIFENDLVGILEMSKEISNSFQKKTRRIKKITEKWREYLP